MADTSFAELWPVQIEIIGPSSPVNERSTFQMRALVTYEDNSQQEVDAVWSAPASQYGSISPTGLFTGDSVIIGTRSVQVNCQFYHAGSDSTLRYLYNACLSFHCYYRQWRSSKKYRRNVRRDCALWRRYYCTDYSYNVHIESSKYRHN